MIDPFIISLVLYVVIAVAATVGIDKIYRNTKLGFFVSNRTAPNWQIAFSAAASWMYVFAIVMTASFAVTKGPSGSLWLSLPMILTVTYFGVLGHQLLSKFPEGFTFSQFIKDRYQNVYITRFYQVLHIAAAVYAVGLNLTGFGVIAEYVSKDFSYNIIVAILGVTVLSYSIWGGIKASLRTDTVQMIMILLMSVVFGSLAVSAGGGLETVLANWSQARPGAILDPVYMLDPGLLLLLLGAGSIMADNGAFQKIYSYGRKDSVIQTYLLAGAILTVCYLFLSLLAASAFSLGIVIVDPKLAGIQVTEHVIGYVGTVLFVLVTLSKASSSSDTALNSAGSVVANDFFVQHNPLMVSRITMVLVMLVGVIIATLKIDIWILITTFGVFRLLAVAPTLYALFSSQKIQMNLVFWTMLTAGAVGLVVTIAKLPVDKLTLAVCMILAPAVALAYETAKNRHAQ